MGIVFYKLYTFVVFLVRWYVFWPSRPDISINHHFVDTYEDMTATLPVVVQNVLVKHVHYWLSVARTNNIVRARNSYFLPAVTVADMVASHSRNVVSTRDIVFIVCHLFSNKDQCIVVLTKSIDMVSNLHNVIFHRYSSTRFLYMIHLWKERTWDRRKIIHCCMLRLLVPDKCGPIQMTPVHSLIFRSPTNQERAFLPPVIWTGRWSALAGPRTNLTVRTGRPAHLLLTVYNPSLENNSTC